MIAIYTDGACSGNPGIGGWGAVILKSSSEDPVCINGGELNTTNNRMELTAAIKSILFFEEKSNLEIYTDSKYLKDGIESWINKWKINGWKTANKKQVKNKDLWIILDEAILKHNIKWNWVKGHANNKFNEKADFLARKFIEENN
tara:strand:- start:136 stop:570 length:435 start_codon:yes stop_codon:yes gene_type:complete